jgi:tetraacyldisaccharide 4'-kinase
MSLSSALTAHWYRERASWLRRIVLAPLWLTSWIFATIAVTRRASYRIGIVRRAKVPSRVISVGNLVVGGAGKTPVVVYLAHKLVERGVKVAVLSRGYGGKAGPGPCLVSRGGGPLVDSNIAGDEPVMIARSCPGVGVVVAKRRDVAARYAIKELSAQALLLDDGFQHLRLARDLDVVVVDSERVFGNGRTLPYGPLREPAWALRNAHVVWLSRYDDASPRAEAVAERARRRGQRVVRSAYRVTEVIDLLTGGHMGKNALKGAKVHMLAAIARPESFRIQLKRSGAILTGESVFPDHHPFRPEELAQVEANARKQKADVVVTTEKDAAKITSAPPGWLAVQLGVEVLDGGAELAAALWP